MKIKICGITRAQDISACEELGVDLIGFINVKRSKRYLDLERINMFIYSMENQNEAVLVIEPVDVEEAVMKIKKTGVKNIQFHSLTPEDMGEIKKIEGLNIIKVIGLPEKVDEKKRDEVKDFAVACDCLLFDHEFGGETGGTETQIPLHVALEALEIAKNADEKTKIFLAGGMDAERLIQEGDRIKDRFDWVDFNSGVEDQPGFKNKGKVREILKLVRCIG